MPIIFLIILLVILFSLPFLPGIIELFKRRDAEPLFIKMDYTKDPRYFGKAFKNLLQKNIKHDLAVGKKKVRLSKNEDVEVSLSENFSANMEIFPILYITGTMMSGEHVKFNKEIYVTGDVKIGENNIVRAIASDKNIFVSKGTKIVRWIDTDADITVDSGCYLGVSASCDGELRILGRSSFKRLWGNPIIAGSARKDRVLLPVVHSETHGQEWIFDKHRVVIPPFTTVEKTLILKKDVEIKERCILKESIKVYGSLLLGEGVSIGGNIFSEGDIEISKDSEIYGNVFSQGTITIRENVMVGKSGKIKSVIGKKGVAIGKDSIIFGYVMTEGAGSIL